MRSVFNHEKVSQQHILQGCKYITTSSTLNQVLGMKIRKHMELNKNNIRKKLKMILYDYKCCFFQMIRKKTGVKAMEGQKRLPPSKPNLICKAGNCMQVKLKPIPKV